MPNEEEDLVSRINKLTVSLNSNNTITNSPYTSHNYTMNPPSATTSYFSDRQVNELTEFYQRVYYHLSLILDKIDCLEMGEESLGILTKTYREKALDTLYVT